MLPTIKLNKATGILFLKKLRETRGWCYIENNIANLIIKNIDTDSIKDVSFSLINDDYDVLNNVIVSMYKNIYNAKKEVVFSYNGDIINIFDRISVSGVNGEYVVISTTNKEFNQDIRAWSV